MKSVLVAALLLTIASAAFAEEKPLLKDLIACHEALVERSDGTSQKMTSDNNASTPFVFKSGSKTIFVNDASMDVLNGVKAADGKVVSPNGQKFLVALTNQNKELKYEVEVRKNGELGSVCCSNSSTTLRAGLPEAVTSSQLTEETRKALTKELYARLKTVTGNYQNNAPTPGSVVVAALEKCKDIKFEQDILGTLIKKYSGSSKNSYGGSKSPSSSTGYGPKKAH